MRKSLWLAGLSSLLAVGCSKDPRTAPPLPLCTARGDTVNLAVAAYTKIDPGPIDGCMVFPAPSGSAVEYLLVPQSASVKPNDSQSFKLQATALALAGIEAELVAPEAVPAELSPADQFHLFLRQSERRRSYPAQPRLQRGPEAQLAPQAAPSPPRNRLYTPADSGDVHSLKVCGSLDCKTLQTVDAALMKIGQHIALYVDTAAPKPGLSQADLDALRDVFDNRLYAVDRGAFGAESDIDGNGVVIVLMTNKVNQLVAKPCTGGYVAGYFFGADIDPGFRTSYNNGEVFYSIVPDPSGILSCAHSVTTVNQIVPVTFVHEFQHMISYNEHVLPPRNGNAEILWLNEALSHYAEERGGRSFLPGDSSSFCQFVGGDLSNAGKYFDAPHRHFLVDTSGIGGLANRGAYWLFLRYLIDQYAADTSLLEADVYTRGLVKTGATGVTNVVQHAGNTPFATLVSRWALANWVSDLPSFTAPPELTYKTWSFRSAYPLFNQASTWRCRTDLPPTFPLAPEVSAGSAVSLSDTLRAGSGVYRRATQGAGTPGFTLLFSDETGRALRTSLVPQLNVIRIQ